MMVRVKKVLSGRTELQSPNAKGSLSMCSRETKEASVEGGGGSGGRGVTFKTKVDMNREEEAGRGCTR